MIKTKRHPHPSPTPQNSRGSPHSYAYRTCMCGVASSWNTKSRKFKTICFTFSKFILNRLLRWWTLRKYVQCDDHIWQCHNDVVKKYKKAISAQLPRWKRLSSPNRLFTSVKYFWKKSLQHAKIGGRGAPPVTARFLSIMELQFYVSSSKD